MYRFLCMLCLCVFLASCDEGGSGTSCDFATPTYTTENAGTAMYNASRTGSSTVSSLTYGGANGPVSVNNPSLPFNRTVSVPAGTEVFISVRGTARGGELKAGHAFTDGAAEVDQIEVTCGD